MRSDDHGARRALGSKVSTRPLSLLESPMKSVGGPLIVADPGVPNNDRAGHTCGVSLIQRHQQRQVALPATRRGLVATSYLKAELQGHAWVGCDPDCRSDNLLIGMFHSKTLPQNKESVGLTEGEGKCQVVVATTALGVGLNLPNVSHVVM